MIQTIASISGTAVAIEVHEAGVCQTLATESRPATFADADTFLAVHGYGRTQDWELAEYGMVHAQVHQIDNLFSGVRAARLWDKVGTTHEQFEWMTARELACRELSGDLISDSELSEPYIVAGSSLDGSVVNIHMVGEGQTWDQHHTGYFMPGQLVKVAKRKA